MTPPYIPQPEPMRAKALRMLIEHYIPTEGIVAMVEHQKRSAAAKEIYWHRRDMITDAAKKLAFGGRYLMRSPSGQYQWDIMLPLGEQAELTQELAAIFQENGLRFETPQRAGVVSPGCFYVVDTNATLPNRTVASTQWFLHGDDLMRILPAIRAEYDRVVGKGRGGGGRG